MGETKKSPVRDDSAGSVMDFVPQARLFLGAETEGEAGKSMGILTRWMAAFALLAVTFNPTAYNYVAWSRDYGRENLSVAVLAGLLLAVCYIIFLRATFRSIGPVGVTLVLAIVGALIWVLNDFGILALDNQSLNVWLGIFALSVVLGVGLGWSHVRRALTGQTDVDDIDE
ncbi:MAG: DUF6524 family protein [Roseobacter sp.]|nr:DUF6524 family protein [Roseobacter sp.]